MKKILLSALLTLAAAAAFASEHPHIYVSDSDKASLRDKVENCEWASGAYSRLKAKIDPYAERHRTDPEWIVSRLAMYWKDGEHYTQCYLKDQRWERGEGNAPVPTVRMPGMRIWNNYNNVPLEERTPYNETGDMWGIDRSNPSAPKVLVPYKQSGHMIRGNNCEILTLAEEASFLYWLTGDEKYAAFAADIFTTWLAGTYYMNPILDPGKSSGGPGGYEPGGILGYYDYEQIHDDLAMHAAVAYDFLYPYLMRRPSSAIAAIGKSLPEVAGTVFKRFIDIGFVRGGKSGNWNVNGWNIMLRPILALEENDFYPDGKGRSWYLHYLTTESTQYHDAIPDILKVYDPVTGLWPEAPGYAFSTVSMLLEFSTLLGRCGIDIIADNPIMQKAALAAFPWMDDRANMIVFGDSRGGSANFSTFEILLSYYSQAGDRVNLSRVASALRTGIGTGAYKRETADWKGICTYLADIPETGSATSTERTSYSPFHRVVTMKSSRGSENLMAVFYGGRNGSHLSANGLALQLYGFGWAFAPDAAGYESYWSPDYRYHQSATGSNTILPGYTEGEVTIRAMEPSVGDKEFVNTASVNPDINVCDMQASEKRRTVAIVRTGSADGYYIDIFRSDQADNDYIFHNIGTSLVLQDGGGQALPLAAAEGFDKTYGEGYKWFRNLRGAEWDADFRAVWSVTPEISMNMWMTGAAGRKLYSAEAPYTTIHPELTPDGVSAPPGVTPTLIVRQEGNNAKSSPFIAVFQPANGGKTTVSGIERLVSDEERAALCVSSEGSRKDYIFSSASDSPFSGTAGVSFTGTFGLVTEVAGRVSQLYMAEGLEISAGGCSISAGSPVSASLYQKGGRWFYSSTGDVRLSVEGREYALKGSDGREVCLTAFNGKTLSLSSPDGSHEVEFDLAKKGELSYSVSFKGRPVLERSRAGLDMDNRVWEMALGVRDLVQPACWMDPFEVDSVAYHPAVDSLRHPFYGERSTVRDAYNSATMYLSRKDGSDYRLNVEVRAYNEGIAFRYFLPEHPKAIFHKVKADLTEYTFPAGTMAWSEQWAQARFERLAINDIHHPVERALTVELPGGAWAALADADVDDWCLTKFVASSEKDNTLTSVMYSPVDAVTYFATPWKIIMASDTPGGLLEHNSIIEGLNPPCAIPDAAEWVKPGKIMRETTISTEGAIATIDFCAAHNIPYMLFDWKWYMPCTSHDGDATKVVDNLDMPRVVAYGRQKGVGIWLYVNQHALMKQARELFPLLREWGIVGVKSGFVQYASHRWATWLHDLVRLAADNRLMMNIHDEFRPSGFSRTYPNLLTQEGICGNEEFPDATHNTILPFTRMINGAADYTICYYDKRLKTTHAHQLAASLVFYSPLQTIFWYDRPSFYQGEPEIEWFENLQTVWDESRVLDGAPGQNVTVARRHGGEWFVGALANNDGSREEMPLNFLDPGKTYLAYIYTDGGDKVKTRTQVECRRLLVDASMTMRFDLKPSGGAALRFVPIDRKAAKGYKKLKSSAVL